MLSQFAKTAQAAEQNSPEDKEDDEALAMLEFIDGEEVMEDMEDVNEVAVTDTMVPPDNDDDSEATDPLDLSVQDSDLAAVQQVVEDAGYDECMPMLTCHDINLGRFALFKVCHSYYFIVYCLMSVLQLHTLALKISNSPTIRTDLEDICRACKIPSTSISKDVPTHWNSSAVMVESALPLQRALNMLVVKKEYNKSKGVHLQQYQLSANEWDLLKHLHPLLDVRLSCLKL